MACSIARSTAPNSACHTIKAGGVSPGWVMIAEPGLNTHSCFAWSNTAALSGTTGVGEVNFARTSARWEKSRSRCSVRVSTAGK